MAKKLLPFTVVITDYYPSDPPLPERLKRVANRLSSNMDISTNRVLKTFLAGSLSGTCSTVLFQPLDLVKTRIQQSVSGHHLSAAQPAGMLAVTRHVLQTEHIFGLWRGILPSMTRTVPGVGLYFSSLHWLKTKVVNDQPTPIEAIVLGMVARSFATSVMIPFTVLKTRFESGQFNYNRMSTALVSIYRSEGLRGYSCGLAATLLRDAPYSGIYFMFYTQLKQKLFPRVDQASGLNLSGTLTHMTCGMMAGFLASLATHPADVIKTKMQVQPKTYSSFSGTISLIMRSQGPRGFLVGFAPRMLRRAMMSALAWTVYEEVMKILGLN